MREEQAPAPRTVAFEPGVECLDAGRRRWHALRIIAKDRHADRLAALRAAVFEADALTDQTERAAAADGSELTVELASFLTTVRDASYRLADADVAGLQAAGHTDEEIFELTIAAALGAALHRLDVGLDAIRGAR